MSAPRPSSNFDFALRLVFFALAPFLVGWMALLLPITPTLVQLAITVVAFLGAEALDAWSSRFRVVGIFANRQRKFSEFYTQFPPRPFLYYVFYPLLFPYWLTMPIARREFALFKGFTLGSVALLVASQAYSYFTDFQPGLGLRAFSAMAVFAFFGELIVVLALLIPMVTTVVTYHQARSRKRLWALLVVGLVSVGVLSVRTYLRRDPVISLAARKRVQLRTDAAKPRAQEVQARALREAFAALPSARDDIDEDGKVLGRPLELAHEVLLDFYKKDEAPVFDLWLSRTKKRRVLVLYVEGARNRAAVWLALEHGKAHHDPRELPSGAFTAMKEAADF